MINNSKIRVLILIGIILFSCPIVKAQNIDSTFFYLKNEGENLLATGDFKGSTEKLNEAKAYALGKGQPNQAMIVENKLIEVLWRQYRLEEASSKTYKLIDEITKSGEASLKVHGNSWQNLATIYLFKGAYDSAIQFYDSAIFYHQQRGYDGLESLSSIYNNLGAICRQTGDSDKEYDYFTKSLEIDKEVFGVNHHFVAGGLMNLGTIKTKRLLYDEALTNFNEALSILNNQSEEERDVQFYNKVLINIGTTYEKIGEYQKALNYQNNALKSNQEVFGEEHPNTIKSYGHMAFALFYAELYDSSTYYFDKVLVHQDKFKEIDAFFLINLLTNYSLTLEEIGQVEDAIIHMKNALDISRKSGDNNLNSYNTLNNLGLLYFRDKQYNKAINYFKKALEAYEKTPNSKNNYSFPSIIYLNLALISLENKQYKKGLVQITSSLDYISPRWRDQDTVTTNSIFEKTFSPINFLDALEVRADLLIQLYFQNNNLTDLELALDTYQLIDTGVRGMRRSYSEFTDKLKLQAKIGDTYKKAIYAYYLAYQATDKKAYLEMCFTMSENSKNTIISDAFNQSESRGTAKLPIDLIKLEKTNKANITYYQSILKNLKGEPVSEKIKEYEEKLFKARRSLDSITNYLELAYPDYAVLKYQKLSSKLEVIQQNLPEHTRILEYVISDSTGYVLLIGNNSIEIKEIKGSEKLPILVKEFRDCINHFETCENDQFLANSYQLYQLLIAPVRNLISPKEVDKLVIIPDQVLGYLPFDILLTQPVKEHFKIYKNHPYLIKDYDIIYGHSASLYHRNTNEKQTGNLSFTGFAPIYAPINEESNTNLGSFSPFRRSAGPLQWNQKEVTSISSYLDGNGLLGKEATEQSFKKKTEGNGILHLAMHAFVDNAQPMNSALIFTQENDSLEDGYLHAFELYNMDIEADMVVLSACETGYGKLAKGEGIISLATGFAYAGVPNIVMSHWPVDDHSTSLLMVLFYQYLAEGMSKSKALRLAKLEYLKTAEPSKTHPYFWGGFINIGADNILKRSSNFPWWTITIILSFFLVGMSLFLKWRKINR